MLVFQYWIMANFSLENNGDRIQCREYGNDPFDNANVNGGGFVQPEYLENVSDISDDFEIPSSQHLLPKRYSKCFWIFLS